MVLNAFGQVLIRPADLIYTGLSLVGTKRTSRPPSAPRSALTLSTRPSIRQRAPRRVSPIRPQADRAQHTALLTPPHPTPYSLPG